MIARIVPLQWRQRVTRDAAPDGQSAVLPQWFMSGLPGCHAQCSYYVADRSGRSRCTMIDSPIEVGFPCEPTIKQMTKFLDAAALRSAALAAALAPEDA